MVLNRNSRLLGHVNFDVLSTSTEPPFCQVKVVVKTDLFPDLDITFRILDNFVSRDFLRENEIPRLFYSPNLWQLSGTQMLCQFFQFHVSY